MAKTKNKQNGSSKDSKKELSNTRNSGEQPTGAWSWLFGNYSLILIAVFLITPFGIIKAWGSGYVWFPLGLGLLISIVSFFAGRKNYKELVRMGYIKRFGE